MDNFWLSFLSNFLATFLGLLIGIPISLCLDRKITFLRGRDKRKEEQQRLYQTLDMLSQSFYRNCAQMESLMDTVRKSWGKQNLEIDYSAWEAVKSEVVQYLHNPNLQYRLSHHFSRMKYLVKVSDMYMNYKFGIESAVISRKRCQGIVSALVEYLLSLLPELIQEANELKCDVQKEIIKNQQH